MPLENFSFLQKVIKEVPSVAYALAIAGIAAAGSMVVRFLGYDKAAVIILIGIFIAMILMFVFARMVSDPNPMTTLPGLILLYSVIVFFVIFLTFTVSAFAISWPRAWADFLGIQEDPNPIDSRKSGPVINDAKFPETTFTRINAFAYDDAAEPPGKSQRYWTRKDEDTFVERQPLGQELYFRIERRINYSGCDGYLMHRLGDNDFQIFIPYKGCPTMSLRFRRNPSDYFATLPNMYDIK